MEWLSNYLLIISICGIYQVSARSHGVSRHNACENVSDNTLMIKDEPDSCGKFLACIGQIAAHYKCFSNGVFGNSTVECLACKEKGLLYEEEVSTTAIKVFNQQKSKKVTTKMPKSKKIIKLSPLKNETGNLNEELNGDEELIDEPSNESSNNPENSEIPQNYTSEIDLKQMDMDESSISQKSSTTSLDPSYNVSDIYSTTTEPLHNINESSSSSESLITAETTTVEVTITTKPLLKNSAKNLDATSSTKRVEVALEKNQETTQIKSIASSKIIESTQKYNGSSPKIIDTSTTENTKKINSTNNKNIDENVVELKSIYESSSQGSPIAVERSTIFLTTTSDFPTSSSAMPNLTSSTKIQTIKNLAEKANEENISMKSFRIKPLEQILTTLSSVNKNSTMASEMNSQSSLSTQSSELLNYEVAQNSKEGTPPPKCYSCKQNETFVRSPSNLSENEPTSIPVWSTEAEVDLNFEPTENQTSNQQTSTRFVTQSLANKSSTPQVLYTVPPEQINATHTIFAGQLSSISPPVSKLPDKSTAKQYQDEKDEEISTIATTTMNIAKLEEVTTVENATSTNSLSNLTSANTSSLEKITTQNISSTLSSPKHRLKDAHSKSTTQGVERNMDESENEKEKTGYCFTFPEYHDEDEPNSTYTTPIIRKYLGMILRKIISSVFQQVFIMFRTRKNLMKSHLLKLKM